MSDVIVFVPGFMADGRVFADQITDLNKDYSVMLPAIKGNTIGDIARNILNTTPEKFVVVGHDLGAAIATEMLSRAPNRITGISLLCSNAQAESPMTAAAREPRMVKARMGCLGEALIEDLPSTALRETAHRQAIRDHWLEMAMSMGIEAYVEHSKIMQRRSDYQNILRRTKIPALIIGGRHDTISPIKRQEFIAQLMPRAELSIIENAGHLPMLEAPQSVSAALKSWLERTKPLLLSSDQMAKV